MDILSNFFTRIDVFLLVFARVIGIFVVAPILSHRNVPTYIKIGFSLVCTCILFPFVEVSNKEMIHQFMILMILIIKELFTGMIIGFICYLFYSCIYLAGQMIDMQIGFAMVSVINPEDDTQVPLMGSLFYIMAVLIFLSMNGHHTLIYALKYSFDCIPIGKLVIKESMIDQFISMITQTFIIAFKMGAPVLIAIFISNMLLGILARTMPQMNVFIVGLPLKIFVGLCVMLFTIPLYVGVFEHIFDEMFQSLYIFLNSFKKG